MESKIVEAAMSAIASAFGGKAAELSMDQIKSWFDKATHSVEGGTGPSGVALQEIADGAIKKGGPILDTEISRRNLARWFEIPQEEFSATPPEQLEPDVMIRHLYLEDLFKKWLTTWRYEVFIGEDLEGQESIDFTPDVYGRLNTLHGQFEVCINFICDNPPSQYRVRALLETLESYATDRSEFKWGDIYILATPFEFGRGASASITLQGKEEKYTVIKLEGDDLYGLRCARDDHARLIELTEHVEKARLIGPNR